MCKTDPAASAALADLGAPVALLSALSAHPTCSDVQSFGCGALWHIALASPPPNASVSSGAISAVSNAISAHLSESKILEYALGALSALLGAAPEEVLREFLTTGGAGSVLDAMKAFPANVYVQRNGCLALAHAAEGDKVDAAEPCFSGGAVGIVSGAVLRHIDNDIAFANGVRALEALLKCPGAEGHVGEIPSEFVQRVRGRPPKKGDPTGCLRLISKMESETGVKCGEKQETQQGTDKRGTDIGDEIGVQNWGQETSEEEGAKSLFKLQHRRHHSLQDPDRPESDAESSESGKEKPKADTTSSHEKSREFIVRCGSKTKNVVSDSSSPEDVLSASCKAFELPISDKAHYVLEAWDNLFCVWREIQYSAPFIPHDVTIVRISKPFSL